MPTLQNVYIQKTSNGLAASIRKGTKESPVYTSVRTTKDTKPFDQTGLFNIECENTWLDKIDKEGNERVNPIIRIKGNYKLHRVNGVDDSLNDFLLPEIQF